MVSDLEPGLGRLGSASSSGKSQTSRHIRRLLGRSAVLQRCGNLHEWLPMSNPSQLGPSPDAYTWHGDVMPSTQATQLPAMPTRAVFDANPQYYQQIMTQQGAYSQVPYQAAQPMHMQAPQQGWQPAAPAP